MKEYKRMIGHFFQVKDKYYVFDEEEILPIELDYKTYEYLKQIKNNGFNDKEMKNDKVTELIDSDILFKSYACEEYQLVNQKKVGRVSFPTVHDCNFGCKYCFADAGSNYNEDISAITKEQLIRILDFLYYDFYKEYKKIRFDFVSGGEPLLNFDIIKELNMLTKEYNKRTNKTSFIWVCTNGSLLTDDITRYFEEEKIGLGISFEGDKEIQNEVRPFKNGGQTYDVVVHNIGQILNSKYLTGFTKKFWTLGVITAKTDSIIGLVEEYRKLGVSNLQLKLCRTDSCNELYIGAEQCEKLKKMYAEFSEYIKQRISEDDLIPLCMILNKNDVFGKYLVKLIQRETIIRHCGAGISKISICANGDIYPCDSFAGKREFCIGNIATGVDSMKFGENLNIYCTSCTECWARFVCGGDCYHNALVTGGGITEPLECYCDLYKFLIETAIDLFSFLLDLDKNTQNIIFKGVAIRNEYF